MNSQHIGVVFPGQGSQKLGMLGDLVGDFPEIHDTFTEASDILQYDLWALTQEGPIEELNNTIHTQPALLTASYALWRIIQTRKPFSPMLLAGHSLGEYTALVCADALSFADAVKLVAARGLFMQQAVAQGVGAMAAIIGLHDEKVAEICQQAINSSEEVLTPANFNSIGQVVIAGHHAPVMRAITIAKAAGAKLATLIPVSVPSHCPLMQPAAKHLNERLLTINLQLPKVPVLNNVAVTFYDSIESIREGLTQQLYLPVRWVETIAYFTKAGVTEIIECGPGKLLTGLNKRINKNLTFITTEDVRSFLNAA